MVLVFTFTSIGCKDHVEEQCQRACGIFVDCIEKEFNTKAKSNFKNQLKTQCMDGCTTHNSEILQCFETESNSCKTYSNCLKDMGTFE